MTQVYISVFQSRRKLDHHYPRDNWPYDYGDDPSFEAFHRFNTPVTWGVCRPNVRNKLRRSDIVIFISREQSEKAKQLTYRLCSIATVADMRKQTDIWEVGELGYLKQYTNLLIRPLRPGPGWEHLEPSTQKARPHGDWLWRIAEPCKLKKDDFKPIEKKNRFQNGQEIQGKTVLIGRNFIIFSSSSDETLVVEKPPIVATYSRGNHEVWNEHPLTKKIWSYIMEKARSARVQNSHRWLRRKMNHPIVSDRNPHPPIWFELDDLEATRWRKDLIGLLRK